MIGIEEQILASIQMIFDRFGWGGVALMLVFENATGLTPSEVILGLAGWMLIEAHGLPIGTSFLGGVLAAAASSVGSSMMYWIARIGGRPAVEKMAQWVRIHPEKIYLAEAQFHKWGQGVVFFGRMIPAVRTLVNIPAGLARMPFIKFLAATFAGAYIWCTLLLAAGALLGHEWHLIKNFLEDYGPAIGLIGGVAFVIYMVTRLVRHRARLSVDME